jgi:hypothetical protein
MFKKNFFKFVLPPVAAFLLAMSLNVFAWTGPTATPANNNVPAPLNAGTATQNKSGDVNFLGKVGIGTTSPTSKLQIQKEGYIFGNEWSTEHSVSIWGTDQSLHMGVDTARRAAYFQSIDVGTVASNISLNPLGGNVGIGTASPSAKLEVSVDTRPSSNNYSTTDMGLSNILTVRGRENDLTKVSTLMFSQFNSQGCISQAYTSTFSGFLAFGLSDGNSGACTERMRIMSNGNIGIGTSPSGGAKLHVYEGDDSEWSGRGVFSGLTNAVVIGTYNGVAQIGGHNAALNAWSDFFINPGGGNVGIGTTDTQAKLTVNGSDNGIFSKGYYYGIFSTNDHPDGAAIIADHQFSTGHAGYFIGNVLVTRDIDVYGKLKVKGTTIPRTEIGTATGSSGRVSFASPFSLDNIPKVTASVKKFWHNGKGCAARSFDVEVNVSNISYSGFDWGGTNVDDGCNGTEVQSISWIAIGE